MGDEQQQDDINPVGYDSLWLPEEEDPRRQDEKPVGELATYRDYLHFYRLTLELKCQDLGPEDLAKQSVKPSEMSLLGLVRHMARVEQSWFQRVLKKNLDLPRLDADDPTGGFRCVQPTLGVRRRVVRELAGADRRCRRVARLDRRLGARRDARSARRHHQRPRHPGPHDRGVRPPRRPRRPAARDHRRAYRAVAPPPVSGRFPETRLRRRSLRPLTC